tara:strand:+ start:6660 stop:6854 length:195 start_codon:yes stop_codon:yes gene_type:complete
MSKKTSEIKEAKGFVEVEFLKPIGSFKVKDKSQMHNSTAMSLANKGILKVTKKVDNYKPKKALD